MRAVPIYQLLSFAAWLHRREPGRPLRSYPPELISDLAMEFVRSSGYCLDTGLEGVMVAFQDCPYLREESARELSVRERMGYYCESHLRRLDEEGRICVFEGALVCPAWGFFPTDESGDPLHPFLRGFVEYASRSGLLEGFLESGRLGDGEERRCKCRALADELRRCFDRYLDDVGVRAPELIEGYERWQRQREVDVQRRREWQGEFDENTKPIRPHDNPADSARRLAESVRLSIETDFYGEAIYRLTSGDVSLGEDALRIANFARSSRLRSGPPKMAEPAPPEAMAAPPEAMAAPAEAMAAPAEAMAAPEMAGAEGPAEGREIQARVFDCSDAASPKPLRRAFRKGAPHTVEVRIGRGDGWLTGSEPFPFEELPPGFERYELTVVFVPLTLPIPPQASGVILPSHGDSSICTFNFVLGGSATRFEARILVLYENRILQTALLGGDIVGSEEGFTGAEMSLIVEAKVVSEFGHLEQRTGFDAALVIERTSSGAVAITKLAENHASISMEDDVKELIDKLDELLSKVATKKDEYAGGLESASTIGLLRSLAQLGSLFFEGVVTDQAVRDSIAKGDRIQIIAASPDANLPIEFVYDRPAPRDEAVVCDRWPEALKTRLCQQSCSHSGDARGVICPLAFWGISRVIERHVFDPAQRGLLGTADFVLQSEFGEGRQTLAVNGEILLAATHRIEGACPGGIDRLRDTIRKNLAHEATVASTWEEWTHGVEKNPCVLMLLVHTGLHPDTGVPRMEIGNELWRRVDQVDQTYVGFGHSGPLVLLLGCETGVARISFAGFVAKFRRSGAAIVVCTGAKIHTVHVVPAAEELLRLLGDSRFSGRTFGDVMREARCAVLAAGYPMVLTLSAFGDADWRLKVGA